MLVWIRFPIRFNLAYDAGCSLTTYNIHVFIVDPGDSKAETNAYLMQCCLIVASWFVSIPPDQLDLSSFQCYGILFLRLRMLITSLCLQEVELVGK
jgi:hypothetical protein